MCNADESEPGTFKDRVLMEEDPFAIVEAMTIAAFATGCERAFVYIRGEYPLAASALASTRSTRRRRSACSATLDIEIRRGGGAYICGEETALFESIEGGRGEPRNKPPFPVDVGLFGKPTVVNNVETLANVPHIILDGARAFAADRHRRSRPARACSVCRARVQVPGVYEAPFGDDAARGDRDGGRTATGTDAARGAAGRRGRHVPRAPDELDLRLTHEDTRAAGTTLGSGVVMVDRRRRRSARACAAHRRRSSATNPAVSACRAVSASIRQEEALRRMMAAGDGHGVAHEIALLDDVGAAMKDASICGLGQTAIRGDRIRDQTPGLFGGGSAR